MLIICAKIKCNNPEISFTVCNFIKGKFEFQIYVENSNPYYVCAMNVRLFVECVCVSISNSCVMFVCGKVFEENDLNLKS